jgi:hypothetical protein
MISAYAHQSYEVLNQKVIPESKKGFSMQTTKTLS